MLLIAILLLAVSSVVCGVSFYTNRGWLFTSFRLVSGIAVGSIANLVNIAQNDIVAGEKRPKLQGVQGSSVAFGSIFGLMVGTVFVERFAWNHFYWLEAGLAVGAGLMLYCSVGPHKESPSWKEVWGTMKTIDVFGIVSGAGAIVCALMLLCKFDTFGTTAVIALGVGLAICAAAFFVSGKFLNFPHARPIVPFRLFFRNRTVTAILFQNVFFGGGYYTFIFFVPVTLRVIRGLPAIQAALWLVPSFITHAVWATTSGFFIRWLARTGWPSYSAIFLAGCTVWAVGMVALGFDSIHQYGKLDILFGVLVGFGTGSVFQNSVIAICTHVDNDTKAVAVGTRNVLRFCGGAIGVAISNAILRALLQSNLPADLAKKADSIFLNPAVMKELSGPAQQLVKKACSTAISYVFFASAGMMGLCVLLCFLIRDRGKEQEEEDREMQTLTPNEV